MTFSEAGENDAAYGSGQEAQAATPAPLDITALRAKWAKYDFAAVDALAEGK